MTLQRRFVRLAIVGLGVILILLLLETVVNRNRWPREWPAIPCEGNLKQLGMAVLMYAQDNDGFLPLKTNWRHSTFPYTKNNQVYLCPKGDKKKIGYAMNRAVSGRSLNEFTSSEQAETAMLFDAIHGRPACRHSGGGNVAFVDSHVKWLRPKDFGRLGIGR